MKNMKKVMCIIMAAVTLLAGCGSSQNTSSTGGTQASGDPGSWPSKPITLLCGYSAGGSSDLGCRYLATALQKQLGQPVVVENVTGSGSWVCWNQLLHNTAADGYTFAMVNLNMLYGQYDEENPREEGVDDFELLANHVVDYQVLAVRDNDDRFNDFASLVEYAQNNELLLAVSAVGINAGDATVAKYMIEELGCKITMVPVDGAADATAMFLAGDVDFLSANVGDVMDAEGYHVVVCFSDERSEFLPEVPTAMETGVCDYVQFSARGYAYMKGVDPAIVTKMSDALAAAYDDPDYQANMKKMGAEMMLLVGDDYKALLDEQLTARLKVWGLEKK